MVQISKKIKISKYILAWILILFLAFFLRAYRLDLNPVGLSHDDEIHEIFNAKSLALVGSHSPGSVAGAFTTNDSCVGNCVYGEAGSYLLIPWMWFFPLDLVWSKIPFVFASLGIVLLTGLLFENLFKNKKVGLLVGLLIAINPWAIHFGRTAYFTTFSYTFYLLAAYFFTRPSSFKTNLITGSLISFFASLFYFGTKPIFPFIVAWGILINIYKFKKIYFKFTSILIIVLTLVLGAYFVLLSNSYAGRRMGEIGINSYELQSQTNEQRKISLEIPFIRDLVINKYKIEAETIISKYVGFFNPVYLFVKSTGDTDIYYISNHGYYYLIEFPLLIIGLVGLGSAISSSGIFLLPLVFIALIPAVFKITGDTIYSLRVGLVYPLLSGISAWGIYYLYKRLPKFKYYLTFILIFIYVLSFINFQIMYWFRTPIDKSIGWYHHKRILANYLQRLRETSNKEVIVFTAQPADTFNTYLFYSKLYNTPDNIRQINQVLKAQTNEYNGIKFIDDCKKISQEDLKNKVVFIEQGVRCDLDQKNTFKIANPRDGGGLYNIFNESLCSNFNSNKYPYPRSLEDFKVEDLSLEKFCKTWITNPDI